MSDRMRELHRHPSVRGVGGGLRGGADRKHGVVRAVALESEPVSVSRSAKVRQFAVLIVAALIVVMAIRFIFSPIARL